MELRLEVVAFRNHWTRARGWDFLGGRDIASGVGHYSVVLLGAARFDSGGARPSPSFSCARAKLHVAEFRDLIP